MVNVHLNIIKTTKIDLHYYLEMQKKDYFTNYLNKHKFNSKAV